MPCKNTWLVYLKATIINATIIKATIINAKIIKATIINAKIIKATIIKATIIWRYIFCGCTFYWHLIEQLCEHILII